MRRRHDIPSSLAVAALLASLACADSQRPSVALITLDTTRVDHLSAYGYSRPTTPNLAALAQRAVRFDRAWSTSAWTLPAHASLFTGLYPASHGARFDARGAAVLGSRVHLPSARQIRAGKLGEELTTLAEMLAAEGYRTGAFVGGPWLHRSFGLLQGFETKDDDVPSFRGRSAQEITDRAIAWLQGLGNQQPYFLFVNYFDPHAPYEPLAGYDDLPRAREPAPSMRGLVAGERRLTAVEREILVDRYDGEIRYMDHHLGRLLKTLESRPDGPQALIIVTADHGESFGEGGRFGHTFWLSEELLRIPLIVRYPGGRSAGTRDASPVQLTDVLPLVIAELGLPTPPSVEGVLPGARRAAFAELYREPTARARFGERFDRDLGAAIRWPHKLVRSSRGERTLFELEDDLPAERALADPKIEKRLAELLDGHERSLREIEITPPELSPQTEESLRQLGYIE